MKKILLSLISLAVLNASNGREFTDANGRKIEAEVIAHSGSSVVINRGGKEFTVPITAFSLDDQQYLKGWIEQNPNAVRAEIGFYVDLERSGKVTQRDAAGGAIDDRLKTIPYHYEMIVFNKGPAALEGLTIRYEIYVDDYVDVRGNSFTRMATGGEKRARLQTVAGQLEGITIAGEGRHDFGRVFHTEFYIDRDGGKTDEAATDKVIGMRLRVYLGTKLLGETYEEELSGRMNNIRWQDAKPYEGPGVG
ncbi:MAG: hypothetical protein AAGC68_15020 [Verrucomicrobiota bacterium]